MIHIGNVEASKMESRYRANFYNTISGFKNSNLIGTINENGITNLALFNSLIHLSSNPPYLGFMLRPTTVARHTYENIKANGLFTINHVHEGIIKKAHQNSAKYPREQSEFEACGLSEEYLNEFKAPFVKESNIKISLEFEEEHLVKASQTILVV